MGGAIAHHFKEVRVVVVMLPDLVQLLLVFLQQPLRVVVRVKRLEL